MPGRSQLIELVNYSSYHQLAELDNIWTPGRICSHAGFDRLNQQGAILLFAYLFILSVDDLFGNSKRITRAKWLVKSH